MTCSVEPGLALCATVGAGLDELRSASQAPPRCARRPAVAACRAAKGGGSSDAETSAGGVRGVDGTRGRRLQLRARVSVGRREGRLLRRRHRRLPHRGLRGALFALRFFDQRFFRRRDPLRGRAQRRSRPLPQPDGVADQELQAPRRRLNLLRVGIRIEPSGKLDPVGPDAALRQLHRQLLGGGLPGLVAVVRDQHPLGAVPFKSPPVVRRHPRRSVRRRHVAKARTPEGQRVEQRLAQNDLPARLQRLHIPHPPVRTRQVQMPRRPRPQIRRDLAPVELGDPARLIEHRDHDGPIQMLVAAGPQHPEPLKPLPDPRPLPPVLRRQPVGQAPVRVAEPEALHHLRMPQSPTRQVPERRRTAHQRRAVVIQHPQQQRRVVLLGIEHPRQLHRRRDLHRRGRRGGSRRPIRPQQLRRVAERHPLRPHHPVDDRTPRLTRPQAVPQVLLGRDHQRRLPILVERAVPPQIRPVACEHHPPRLRQPLHPHLALQPLQLALRNPGHGGRSPPP